MKKITQTFIKYTIWAIIFATSSYAYAVWEDAPGPFPDGNKDAPINVGTVAQTKTGPFTSTGFTSLTDAYFATDISVGTVTDPTGLGLVGLFNGKVGATQYCDTAGANCIVPATVSSAGVPAGAIMAFDLATCPTGWTEKTELRGKYTVGLPLGGTRGVGAGTALTNQENRASGRLSYTDWYATSGGGNVGASGSGGTIATGAQRTGTIGTVVGTNAPYVQYLMCVKS